jgi:hypothetical protein
MHLRGQHFKAEKNTARKSVSDGRSGQGRARSLRAGFRPAGKGLPALPLGRIGSGPLFNFANSRLGRPLHPWDPSQFPEQRECGRGFWPPDFT